MYSNAFHTSFLSSIHFWLSLILRLKSNIWSNDKTKILTIHCNNLVWANWIWENQNILAYQIGFFGIGAYSDKIISLICKFDVYACFIDITEISIPSYRNVYMSKETYAIEGHFLIRKIKKDGSQSLYHCIL